jgi:hypothetical protein
MGTLLLSSNKGVHHLSSRVLIVAKIICDMVRKIGNGKFRVCNIHLLNRMRRLLRRIQRKIIKRAFKSTLYDMRSGAGCKDFPMGALMTDYLTESMDELDELKLVGLHFSLRYTFFNWLPYFS